MENTASIGGVSFTNGPVLSRESYKLKPGSAVTFRPARQTVTYTGEPAKITAPEMRIKDVQGSAGVISAVPQYSYRLQGDSDSDYTPGLPVDAGVYQVRASIPATDSYRAGNGYLTLTIEKSRPTLAISDTYQVSKVYDAAPFPAPGPEAVTVTGTAFETVKFTWYKDSVSDANQLTGAPRDAGSYVLKASVDETNNTHGASATADVLIERRPVTVIADIRAKVYGSEDPELTYTIDPSTPLPIGDSLNGTPSREPGENVNDGGYAINQGTLTDSANPNYRITFKPGIFNIEKETLIPAPQAETISQYQITLKQVSLTSASGAVGTVEYGINEIYDENTITWQTSPVFSGLEPGVTYYFFVKIEGNSNYVDGISDVAYLTTLKIRLAKPTAKAGKNYVYTGEAISVELDGVDNELMSVDGETTAINAGDYTVTVSLKNPARYAWEEESEIENIDPFNIAWQIEKADQAEVSIEAVTARTYGDPAFRLTAVGGTGYGQFLFSVPENNQVLSVSEDYAVIIGAGSVTVTAVKQGDINHNDSETATLNVTVSKKPVTVKAADKTRYVGKNNPELTLEDFPTDLLVGNDGSDALGVTLTTTAGKDSGAGTYPITGTSDSANYDVTVLPGTLTVAPTPEYRIDLGKGIFDVPDALKGNPDLDTPEEIEEAMRQSIRENMAGIDANHITVYDVTLSYSVDNGATWQKAGIEEFPEEGVTVTLPYPTGINSTKYQDRKSVV